MFSLKIFFTNVWSFIEPTVTILVTQAGQLLTAAALNAVSQVAKDPSIISNVDKRNAAFDLIVSELKEKGISMAVSDVNTALELANKKFKSTNTAQSATSGSPSGSGGV